VPQCNGPGQGQGLGLPQVVLKNMSLVRATVSIKRISAEPEDEAVFAFSPKHVVGRLCTRLSVPQWL
jgi:hypothetical protein